MFKLYTRNRCKPPGYAKNLLRAIQIAAFIILANNPQTGNAQQSNLIDIKGTVYDDQGKPLAGATIKVNQNNRSVKTNEKGEFLILRVKENTSLTISYLGFNSMEISASTRVNIKMSLSNSNLDEVEVISNGFQNLSRDKITGSISLIDNKTINRGTATNILDRIKNMAPGIYFQDRDPQISRITTNPTAKSSGITIRGQSTYNGSKEPLIILDNFPYDGEINNINPNDIESISILKDASAAAIWGARSGNGVIVLTTKKGKLNQKLKIDLTSSLTVANKPDLKYSKNFLNSKEYIEVEQFLFDKGFFNNQLNDAASFPIVSPAVELMAKFKAATTDIQRTQLRNDLQSLAAFDVRDDYSNYFYQKAINQQYALGFRGGSENVIYSISIGRDENKNNLKGNGYNRTTINSSTTFSPIKNLELSIGLHYSRSKTALNNEYSYGSLAGLGAPYVNIYPYASLVDSKGEALPILQNLRTSYLESTKAKGFLDWNLRPYDELNLAEHTTLLSNLQLRFGAKYKVTPSLNIQLNYQNESQAIDEKNHHSIESYYSRNLINRFSVYTASSGLISYNLPKGGILDLTNTTGQTDNLRGQLNFNKSFGKHDFSALLGSDFRSFTTEGYSRTSYGYNDQFGVSVNNSNYNTFFPTNPSGTGSIPAPPGALAGFLNRSISYFAAGTYSYKSRYTLNLSARKDGANLFGAKANDKFKPFLSAGLGWNLSDENFYNVEWLPYLKFRGTYGYQGNTYQTTSAYLTGSYSTSSITGLRTLNVTTAPNPRLQWEKIKNINLGVDFAIKNNRISGSIELFKKDGSDLIQPTVLSQQSGFATYFANTASTKSTGLDISVRSQNLEGDFKWNSTFILSAIKDKVVKYDAPLTAGSISNGGFAVGYPLNSIFSYKWEGLNPENGNPRGSINSKTSEDYLAIINNFKPDSLVYNGSQIPTVYGSLRNEFSFKRFTMSVNVVYRLGYVFRRSSTSLAYENIIKTGQHADYNIRWQKPGDENSTSVPSLLYPSNPYREIFYQLSQSLVESGDHIRLQDIRLAYDLAPLLGKRSRISNLTAFGFANNLGIIWRKNKLGIDPSAGASSASQYPIPFSISFGLTANF